MLACKELRLQDYESLKEMNEVTIDYVRSSPLKFYIQFILECTSIFLTKYHHYNFYPHRDIWNIPFCFTAIMEMRTSRWAWSSIPCRWPTSRFSWSFISSVSLLCSERKYCVLINVQLINRLLIVIKIHERWNWSRSEEDFGLGFPNCSLSPAVGNNFPDVYHTWHDLRILSRTRQICYRGGVIEELISLTTKIQLA